MTGWRIGYIAAPKYIAKACTKLQGQFTSATNSIAQRATIAALLENMNPTFEMREAFRKRRDMVVELMQEIPGIKIRVPEGAFYVFPDVSDYYGKHFNGEMIRNSGDLSMFLLNEGLVATVPGDPFGSPGCIRMSYASSEEVLREAINRIKTSLAKLS